MSPKLALVAIVLMVGIGVAWCQEAAIADDIDTLAEVDYQQEDGDQLRDKRQAVYSQYNEKDELRRHCLRKSHQACCSLLKKDAVKFATCVKGYSWSNKDKNKPGCPGYPRCPGFKRG